MTEISFEYWNKLAEIMITIGSLLGGFSIAIIANLLVSDTNTRLSKYIMIASIFAASFFLITVFAMTGLLMKTTQGYPMKVTQSDLLFSRVIGIIALLFGLLSLITIISLSGWSKSKRMGRFTTVVGVITFIILMILMT